MTNEKKAREITSNYRNRMLMMGQVSDTDWLVYELLIEAMKWKEKQMIAKTKTFIKEIARVCDITDENGYRVDERYLLAEFENQLKENKSWK